MLKLLDMFVRGQLVCNGDLQLSPWRVVWHRRSTSRHLRVLSWAVCHAMRHMCSLERWSPSVNWKHIWDD